MTKRTGFLQLEEIPLNKVGLSIRAYGKRRIMWAAWKSITPRLAAFTGPKGKKCIANLSWEKLFAQFEYAKASLEFPLAKGATLKKLYVGNLPFQATEEDISNWVKQAGATSATVNLVKDRDTGQPRGFGFVEINNDEEASSAIQSLNGQNFMGRNVVVNEARPREGGGGRGRGEGGGGRGGYGGNRGQDRGGSSGRSGGRGRY